MNNQPDSAQRFLFITHNVRGEIVRLDESFQTIMRQHAYPKVVQKLLGETLLAAVLISDMIKYKGQLTIQFQSDGPIKLLVAKCDHHLYIRGLAQWEQDALSEELKTALGDGELVMTIERDDLVQPYQSIVPVKRRTVGKALEQYFLQSEQLATKFLLLVTQNQAVGILLQKMPTKSLEEQNNHFWQQVTHSLEVIHAEEVIAYDNAVLLKRLHPNENIQMFTEKSVAFRCRCTIERMEDAVKTFGKEEAEKILAEKHNLVVTCEYCNNEYNFNRDEVKQIFSKN